MKRNLVSVVGLGPGDAQFLTAQARHALQEADVLCGYTVYIDLVRPLYPEKETYATGMTREIDRCRWALQTAQTGKTVALVCSGDAGVYPCFRAFCTFFSAKCAIFSYFFRKLLLFFT